ncbi:hypothetical protein LIA77_00187 [Sarocladium implicatum]|nr:hypothetical protein LIA77_00187 [Sarocladium implicatum]
MRPSWITITTTTTTTRSGQLGITHMQSTFSTTLSLAHNEADIQNLHKLIHVNCARPQAMTTRACYPRLSSTPPSRQSLPASLPSKQDRPKTQESKRHKPARLSSPQTSRHSFLGPPALGQAPLRPPPLIPPLSVP